ncbi:NADPH-dependent oxidoreductase [Cetobacterium ceti]
MLKTVDVIKDHRCIRKYLQEDVPDSIIEEIIVCAQSMPNSLNGQQTSIIVVKDLEKRKVISQLSGNQPWIEEAPVFLVFIADFYKTHKGLVMAGENQIIETSGEGLLVGAVDVGIALGAAVIAGESLGLGVVPIGGIRNNPDEIIKLLKLPPKTFPIAGLVIGYPLDPSRKKPRLPLNTYLYKEEYDRNIIDKEIEKYNLIMKRYLKEIGRESEKNWSIFLSKFYKKIYFPKVQKSLINQGFEFSS